MERWIRAYLKFGYVPELTESVHEEPWATAGPRLSEREAGDPHDLVRRGTAALHRLFDDVPAGDHIVPVTGGLDSRAILGELLRNVDANRVRTVTFGRPRTLDVEIGQRVARIAGVRWDLLDVASVRFDAEALLRFAATCPRPIPLLDAYVLHQIRARYGPAPTYWYGYLNDVITGGARPRVASRTWDDAIAFFLEWNHIPRIEALTPPGTDPLDLLPAGPFLPPWRVCYDDQLDLALRQPHITRIQQAAYPHRCRLPFEQRDWIRFNLVLPLPYRSDQWLFREMMKSAHPRITAAGIKANRGFPLDTPRWRIFLRRGAQSARKRLVRAATLRRHGSHPYDKYLDWDVAFRSRPDLKEVGHHSLERMSRRGLLDWLDLERIWDRHRRGYENHGHKIWLLTGLDHFLTVREAAGLDQRARGVNAGAT